MRVADYIVKFLEGVGIDRAFTVCGGGSIFINDALRKAERMKFVATHHEQAAAMAAEAWARVRGVPGLVVVTSGPGGTNAITGVAGAWMDSVPMIVISGQAFLSQTITDHPELRQMGVQEINIVDLVDPITKYAVMVTDPKEIRWHLEYAWHQALDGRPGPVWLDIPADVQNADIDPDELRGWTADKIEDTEAASIMREQIFDVVELLRAAKRPLVHVGQGVRIAGAVEDFFEFVDLVDAPFVTARNANDICDDTHPRFIGRPGTFAQRGANFAVQSCDIYIAIGTRLSLAQTGYNAKDYARNAKKVVVDIDPAELSKGTVPIDIAIEADAGDFLKAINRSIRRNQLPRNHQWNARCHKWRARYPAVTQKYRDQAEHVNSYHFADRLSAHLTPSDIIVTDMGFAFQTTHQAFRVKLGQRFFTNCGMAAMGWGLPAAVGAAIASGRRTICITGDGGLMMNAQELSTIAHHRLPVKIFVLNNGGYLTMRQSQENAFDGYMGSDYKSGLSFPDFRELAHAHGIRSTSVLSHANLERVMSAALVEDGPILVELVMDPNQEAVKSVNRREADGTIKQTAIEDAFPHLDPAEIADNLKVDP